MGEKKSGRSKKTVVALTLAVACAATAAIVIAARRQPAASTDAAPAMQQEAVQASGSHAPAMSAASKPAPGTSKKLVPTKVAASAKAPASAKARVEDVTPAKVSEVPAAKQIAASEMKTPAQESLAKGVTPPMAATTLSGCLERDGDGFRLKDTDGAVASKGRSWKSGFLKKGAPKIDLVDPANRLKFKDHVGQRVSVTGLLIDREMQAKSLQRVETSCE